MNQDKPVIVCLCGSTRFTRIVNANGRSLWQEANLRETLQGRIVLSVGVSTQSDIDIFGKLSVEAANEIKAKLDELHLRKIDLADQVLILDHKGYIGQSTQNELAYARAHSKIIRWLEPCEHVLPGEIVEFELFEEVTPIQQQTFSLDQAAASLPLSQVGFIPTHYGEAKMMDAADGVNLLLKHTSAHLINAATEAIQIVKTHHPEVDISEPTPLGSPMILAFQATKKVGLGVQQLSGQEDFTELVARSRNDAELIIGIALRIESEMELPPLISQGRQSLGGVRLS